MYPLVVDISEEDVVLQVAGVVVWVLPVGGKGERALDERRDGGAVQQLRELL